MAIMTRTRLGVMSFVTAAALGLTACGGDTADTTDANASDASTAAEETAAADDAAAADAPASEVTDMDGNTVQLPENPQSIVATDNRIFQTLADWGIELSAAPVTLMPDGSDVLATYQDVPDMGNHREPNFEIVTAAQPDLILNGQRFVQHAEGIAEAAPDAVIVSTNINASPVDGEGNEVEGFRDVAQQYRDLTALLGDIFGRQSDAQALIDAFDEALNAAKDAYNPEQTVAALITSGGEINYAAPTTGRTLGPLFDILELTPAFEADGSSNHQGDAISVEAIAEANPDWLIVMDRDAGAGSTGEGYQTAQELIEGSEALSNTTAVTEGNIVYLNPEFYTAEDIQHYTELFEQLAEAWA